MDASSVLTSIRNLKKPKSTSGALRRLMQYFKPYNTQLTLILIFAALSVGFTIFAPKILGEVTNLIVEGSTAMYNGVGGIDFAAIAKVLGVLAIVYLVSSGFSFAAQRNTATLSQKTIHDLRVQVNAKLAKLPLNYYDTHTYGEVLSRTTSDIERISTTLQQALNQLITSMFTIVGIIIMMLTISPLMTIIALLILPIAVYFTKLVIGHSQKYFVGQQSALGDMNSYVEEMYSGHNIIKLFNKEKTVESGFEQINESMYKNGSRAQFYSSILMPIIMFVGNLGYVMVCIVGGLMTTNNMLSIGGIQAFIQYVQQFTQPLTQTANIANVFQQTMAAAERVFELLDEPELAPEREKLVEKPATDGNVTFDHVRFGYVPGRTLINDMNLDVRSGQKIAIVGPTGAGKTTLVNLLLRFYEVGGGSIKIDGVDINDMSRQTLRKLFGMVLQETWLYSGSVKDNIRYANSALTDEQVVDAAKMANVDFFIRTWPGGYEMQIEEDADNISQGQKQLLTIARAFASDPKILILDEATSSVDTRTERLIQEAMSKLTTGRTSFVIAHRLSTIKDSDIILYMQDGDILEQGNHDALIEKNGLYAALYNSQFAE